MFVLPNVSKTYPRANEFTKDLISAVIGAGILRAAGVKFEVGQLSMPTLAFGSGAVAVGSAIGREALLRTLFTGANFERRDVRNQLNESWIYVAALTTFAAGTFALTQYSRVGTYLPAFTQLNRNQALALGGSTIGMLAGLRFFGFANEAKGVKRRETPPPQVPEYDPRREGEFSSKSVEDMLGIQGRLDRREIAIPESMYDAWNAQVDVHTDASEDRAVELRKLGGI